MIRRILMIGLMSAAAWQLTGYARIHGKAWLGQQLLERAWQRIEQTGQVVEPWPGAVSHPVGRLSMPRLDIEHLVLEGVETPVLAWGPCLETGAGGHRLLAGHRDTHFRFLQQVRNGDRFKLQLAGAAPEAWQVRSIDVVDARLTAIDMSLSGAHMTLVTCYPFDAVNSGGPLRLVVRLAPAADHRADREDRI